MPRYEMLPLKHEFSDYNSTIIIYNTTKSEILKLQKENRERLNRIRELHKKYFNAYGLTNEAKQIFKKYNITTYQGVKIKED